MEINIPARLYPLPTEDLAGQDQHLCIAALRPQISKYSVFCGHEVRGIKKDWLG